MNIRAVKPATGTEVLALRLQDNDVGAFSVREFFQLLLEKVWTEEDDFNPKRPWGDSYWKFPIELALVKAGFVHGTLVDDDGNEHPSPQDANYVDDVDEEMVDLLILSAIDALGTPFRPPAKPPKPRKRRKDNQ